MVKFNRWPALIIGILIILGMIVGRQGGTLASDQVDRIVIGDDRGDWGLPAPYTHVRRGPGLCYTSLVFDTLIWKDKNGQYIPALAQSWEYLDEEKAWVFQLNDKAKWHDGRPVNPEDVVFTVNYSHKHPYHFSDTSVIDRVEKTGDHGIKIFLKQYYAPFLSDVAVALPIIPRHIYEKIDDAEKFTETVAATGSGPYVLKQYDMVKGQYLFESFKDYYQGPARVKQIAIVKMPPPVAVRELGQGNIDLITRVPSNFIDKVKAMDVHLVSALSGHPTRLIFNHTVAPFDDIKVRHALAYAIDRNELVQISQGGSAEPAATGGISTANPWVADQLPGYDYDSEKAWQLLQEAGFKKDDQGRILYHNEPWEIELISVKRFQGDGAIISHQLEKQGVKVNLRVLNQAALNAKLAKGDFQLSLDTGGGLGDPKALSRRLLGNAPNSDRYQSNKELIQLLEDNIHVQDQAKRKIMTDRAQQLYALELPSYALYCPVWTAASSKKIRPYYTQGGVAFGIPLPLNKLIFIK